MARHPAPAGERPSSEGPVPGSTWQKPVVRLLFGAAVLFSAAGFALFVANHQTIVPGSWGSSPGSRAGSSRWITSVVQYVAAPLLAASLGALIVSRRPGQRIGWLLMALGLVSGAMPLIQEWAIYSHYTLARPLPGAALAAWTTNWLWLPLFALALLMPALVPTGRFLSRRWALAITAGLAIMLGPILVASFIESPMSSAFQMPNPFFERYSQTLYDTLFTIGVSGILLVALAVLGSVAARFRASQGRERQQIKWLLGGMAFMALAVVAGFALSLGLDIRLGDVLVNLSLLWPLLGIGVALLRHQLYDIDIILRGTLTYGLLSAVLVGLYFGSVIVLQTIFGSLTGEQSPVVIVISTLFIAALFAPLRRRLQNAIDRRFFRQKYDAEQVLARFAQIARDETDLEALEMELLAVVEETMRPDRASVWLKPARRGQ